MEVPVIFVPFMLIYYILESIVRLILPRPPQHLQGKVVLVTGAAQGIGLAIAKQFHLEGCTVVLSDIAQVSLFLHYMGTFRTNLY